MKWVEVRCPAFPLPSPNHCHLGGRPANRSSPVALGSTVKALPNEWSNAAWLPAAHIQGTLVATDSSAL